MEIKEERLAKDIRLIGIIVVLILVLTMGISLVVSIRMLINLNDIKGHVSSIDTQPYVIEYEDNN